MNRPHLLDLFCGAGGAAMGYHRAGFDVTGVDIKPQKHYPFTFVQGDALEYCRDHGHEYDAIHASPPCQRYSVTRYAWNSDGIKHPDLLAATRGHLELSGRPWVIENVVGAPLQWFIVLCGVMFGLKTYRHRRLEMSFLSFQPAHKAHPEKLTKKGRSPSEGGYSNPCGHASVKGEKDIWAESLAIEWMSAKELTQAIPPAYTQFIGEQLMKVLSL